MKEKILLSDVDGCITQFLEGAQQLARIFLGKELDIDQWDIFASLTKEEEIFLYDLICKPGFCANLKAYPNACETLAKLNTLSGLKLYILTAPVSNSDYWMPERKNWLVKHIGIKPKQIIFADAKELVFGNYFLDDKLEHLIHWLDRHPDGQAWLWNNHDYASLPTNVAEKYNGRLRLCNNWDVLFDKINDDINNHENRS